MSFDKNTQEIIQKSLDAYRELKINHTEGDWSASPVEEKNFDLRDFLLQKKGVLEKFRRTYLVAGRHNFPDSPRGGFYIEWGTPGDIPIQLRIHGRFKVFWMVAKLSLYKKFRLNFTKLVDKKIGKPVTQNIFGLNITESQIRNFYYKEEIKKYLGSDFDAILEVGGGFGGLAGELLKNFTIKRYYFVDLFDALPLAYFYLRQILPNDEIQILTHKDSEIKSSAKVIILPPSLLYKISNKISLFINTMSFQHMNLKSINFYLKEASRLETKNLFLNNRDWIRDPSDIKISDYPIPKKYKKFLDKKWLYGNHRLQIFKIF
tara:strand:+ start:882 stop:1838 length:957 start_codon:yes stop_codon:yes gene_type:complete